MNINIQYLIGIIIITLSNIYIWSKLLNKNPNIKQIKTYIIFLLMAIVTLANYLYNNRFVRIVAITVIMSIFIKILFKEKVNKSIIASIFTQLIYMVVETIYALILSVLLGPNIEKILEFSLGTLITNASVSILACLITQTRFIKILFNKLMNFTEKLSYKYLIIFGFFSMLVANIFAMTTYFQLDFTILLIFNVIMTLVCFGIIVHSIVVENNYSKVYDKYNIAINSLNDYEEMINKYKVTTHENKNLLMTIRTMIANNEKGIPDYIDSLVEEKYSDDEKLLFKVSVIPSGGLRATIYSEILKIQKRNINYTLDIDKQIKTIDLIELDTNTIINICKVISVFIDNAIDEVSKLKSKNINISLYLVEKKLNIKVSNNYSGNISIEKIYNEGYTTKGKGHGYGLSLVKEIVNNSSLFTNNIEINKDVFSQILSIHTKS